MEKGFFNLLIAFASSMSLAHLSYSQHRSSKASEAEAGFSAYAINLADELDIFNNGLTATTYRISLCADVPNNKKPWKVAYHQETGHVFLVLQKIAGVDTINKVFGFYPRRGLPTLLFRKVKSKIKDNSRRTYDADITEEVSAAAFDTVLAKAVLCSERYYHINKFNCYDYAVEIFNSIAGDRALPERHIKFPFIFGKGGSPCAVYQDLKKLSLESAWSHHVRFGNLTAPTSTHRTESMDQ